VKGERLKWLRVQNLSQGLGVHERRVGAVSELVSRRDARHRQVSPADLAVAAEEVFAGGQFFEGHGAAGVEFVGGDADFRAEAEFAAVGEARAGVPLFAGFRNGVLRRLGA